MFMHSSDRVCTCPGLELSYGVAVLIKQYSSLLQVTEIKLKYFDTTPVATAMNVLKTGFLFVASEFGNQ